MKKLNDSILFLLLLIIPLSNVMGQTPRTLNYQGKITDAGAQVNGNLNITFSIYDSSTGGAALWSESIPAVAVKNGLFSVILGKSKPISLQTDKPLWIGTKIGSDSEISPRVELSGNMYALNLALPY